MMDYQIHQTRRGDYGIQRAGSHIVEHDRTTGRERRYPTRAAAELALSVLVAEEARDREEHEQSRTQHAAHDQMMQSEAGDLVARQLAWQAWRNDFYARMRHAGRAASSLATKPVSEHGTRNPGYGEAQRSKQDRAIAEAAELRQAYARAVALDAAIKASYAHGEPTAYEAALAAGEELMREWGQAPAAPALPSIAEENRTAELRVRLTPAEREQLHADAAGAGQTVSDYLRDLANLRQR